jgi:hypothetical protein
VNKKDIIQHFTTLIKPQLISINQQQIVIRRRLQLGGLVLSSLAIFIYIKTSLSFSNAMMGAIVLWCLLAKLLNRKVERSIRTKIMREVFELLMPGCAYHPQRKLSKEMIKASRLFPEFHRVKGRWRPI